MPSKFQVDDLVWLKSATYTDFASDIGWVEGTIEKVVAERDLPKRNEPLYWVQSSKVGISLRFGYELRPRKVNEQTPPPSNKEK